MIKDTPKGLMMSVQKNHRIRKRNGGHTRCRKIYGKKLS